MPEIKIIEERPITLAETFMLLEKIEKRDKILNEKAVKTKEYFSKSAKTQPKQLQEIRKKLEAAEVLRLKPKHIVKILDIMPEDIDDLKALFASENITLKQEDLNKILECLK